ncbi:MAG TPA: hypothetical protein VGZ73_06795, partial [Bryobacteraceae bacterium]|nr:hypothetical protein [Bryobacteraceae bacterium]
GKSLSWRDCLLDFDVAGSPSRLSLLSAGQSDPEYMARMQSLNFEELFDKYDLGFYIEQLRDEWAADYDFVLVDSRTGVTDIGGICTVHLADILVLLFTTTDSSMEGAADILERARRAQSHLPVDRGRLLAVPVPARDESRTEYKRAAEWNEKFAKRFSELYWDWLPSGTTPHDAIDLLRIPYVPYWSFGEPLPAIEERNTDPASLGHAYEILARVLAARLDWYAALEGQTLAPPPTARRRELDPEWLGRHRRAALERLSAAGMQGFMEICHFSPDSPISKPQGELLSAARQAEVHTLGWPTGVVLDRPRESRPAPIDDGVFAIFSGENPFSGGHVFAYWTLTKSGDFYTLMSLSEDHVDENRARNIIWFDTRIVRAAEVLLHSANLYRVLGVEPNAHVEMTVRYGGLRKRSLGVASTNRGKWLEPAENLYEDEVRVSPLIFKLGAVDTEIVELVKKLCEPLFVIFDYTTFPDDIYQQIVTDFVKGKVT